MLLSFIYVLSRELYVLRENFHPEILTDLRTIGLGVWIKLEIAFFVLYFRFYFHLLGN